MKPDDWERLSSLIADALERPVEERDAFLVSACGGDADLLERARELLASHAKVPTSFLAPPSKAASPETPPPPAFEPPKQLGDFDLLEEIGRGGMAVVHRARQRSLDREVALKLLVGSAAASPRYVERFQREARAIGRLEHPHIVKIYLADQDAEVPYFAMERVRGHDLRRELEILTTEESARTAVPLALPEIGASSYVPAVVALVAKLADALQAAHDAGIVHRDVKPSNVLLTASGEPKLADFGLSRDESFGQAASRTQAIEGTPYYMSPEQARLARTAVVDRRTDVYSLGVVLYELLARRRPFEGQTSHEILSKICYHEPVPLRRLERRVPRDLAVIAAKAMAKEPPERYESAKELAADLRRFLAHESIHAEPPRWHVVVRRFVRRYRVALAAAALLLIGLLAGLGWASRAAGKRLVEGWNRDVRAVLADPEREVSERDMQTFVSRAEVLAADDLFVDRALHEEIPQRVTASYERSARPLRERLPAALTPVRNQSLFGVDVAAFSQSLVQYADLVGRFPEHASKLAELVIAPLYVKLDVVAVDAAGNEVAGTASLVQVDPLTGLPASTRELGPLPVRDLQLEPVFCRIVVRPTGHPSREFSRVLAPGQAPEVVRCEVAPERFSTNGMVLVPAGDLSIPPKQPFSAYSGQTIRVESFWVDETLVSIREYRDYLSATGREQPLLWALLPAEIDAELPAVAVSWDEARAYAEWVGKRLLTAPERDFAMRGARGADWPYAVPEGGDPYRGAVQGSFPANMPAPEIAALFALFAMPVRSAPEARSEPHGLYHGLGNARDWVESLAIDGDSRETLVPVPYERLALGGTWYAKIAHQDLKGRVIRRTGRSFAFFDIGFRCARSATP